MIFTTIVVRYDIMLKSLELTKSKLRQKILSCFFTNPEAKFYVRELSSFLRVDAGNLSRELSKLEKEGIFSFSRQGNQKIFSLNKGYPLFKELKSIILKTDRKSTRLNSSHSAKSRMPSSA